MASAETVAVLRTDLVGFTDLRSRVGHSATFELHNKRPAGARSLALTPPALGLEVGSDAHCSAAEGARLGVDG